MGHQLFERDNRQVRLTPAGRHFLDYARKAVDDWQQLRGDLNANHPSLSGEVSLFGSVTASYSMLAQILPKMRETFPGIDIKLRTGDQADGVERVLDGAEDCAIVAAPSVLPGKLVFLPLRSTPLRLIGPKTPSMLSRQLDQYIAEETEPDWNELPMVLAERGLARERLLAHLKSAGKKPHIYAHVAGHEALVSIVSLGFGVAVVPELVIHHSPQRETVRVLPWLSNPATVRAGLVRAGGTCQRPINAGTVGLRSANTSAELNVPLFRATSCIFLLRKLRELLRCFTTESIVTNRNSLGFARAQMEPKCA